MHRALASSALFLASLSICLPCNAQVVPGTYAVEFGGGELVIRPAQEAKLAFKIHTVGGNFHSCLVKGNIIGHRAVLLEDDGSRCELTFSKEAKGYRVSSDQGPGCRSYCGMRATLENYYERTPMGCSAAERQRSRSTFKSLYGKKQYATALAKLEPVLTNCNKYMSEFEKGWVSNDLALTQYKLGKIDACLLSLQALTEDTNKTDQQILEKYVSPAVGESWLPIIKATRTNLKLCQSAKTGD